MGPIVIWFLWVLLWLPCYIVLWLVADYLNLGYDGKTAAVCLAWLPSLVAARWLYWSHQRRKTRGY